MCCFFGFRVRVCERRCFMQAMRMRFMSYFALQKMLQTSNARAARYRFHFTCEACHALQLVKLLRRQLLEQNNIKADDDVDCKD